MAEKKYRKAIEINQKLAEAYFNYALLLENELGRKVVERKKNQKTIEIKLEDAES